MIALGVEVQVTLMDELEAILKEIMTKISFVNRIGEDDVNDHDLLDR